MPAAVLVTGATGNVGGAVVRRLLERAGGPVPSGIRPRVAVRDPGAAAARFGPGVDAVLLDFHRPETFPPALAGVSSLFLLRPPAIARVRATLCALVDAAAAAGVGHVVFLSVTGADRNRFVPHHAVEVHLQSGPVPWTILRPGFFAQNIGDTYRPDIRERDEVYLAAGRGQVAWVDARDLGELAADILLDPAPHRGRAYTLTGSETADFAEVAGLLSRAAGRPIRYVPASALGQIRRHLARGMPLAQALIVTLLHLGLRRGQRGDATLAGLLGRPARTVADYIADHAELWRR